VGHDAPAAPGCGRGPQEPDRGCVDELRVATLEALSGSRVNADALEALRTGDLRGAVRRSKAALEIVNHLKANIWRVLTATRDNQGAIPSTVLDEVTSELGVPIPRRRKSSDR